MQNNNNSDDELPPYIVPPCPREPEIVHADEDLLVVNKPEFLLTVPGRHKLNKDCLITRLQEDFGFTSARIVHRLDLDTSGLVVIPLNKQAQSHISRQFQQRNVSKSYIAEVWGKPGCDYGAIDLPIKTDWENRPLQKIDWGGRNAETWYETLSVNNNGHARLLLKPHTGRSHQLRIHTAWIGHPIRGCDMYAHQQALDSSPRLLLHAWQISFRHPRSEKLLTVTCEPAF